MRIYVIRHAERQIGDFYNPALKHQDSPISETGQRQAQKLVNFFRSKPASRIMISAYLRTAQTALPLAEHWKCQPEIDPRLNEIDNGVLEAMTDEEIRHVYPDFWTDFTSHARDVRFPEGESGDEVKQRQERLLNDLIMRDEDAVLYSHEGYIRLLMCHLLGLPVYRRHLFKVDFCGIVEIEYDAQQKIWRIIKFNQTLDLKT